MRRDVEAVIKPAPVAEPAETATPTDACTGLGISGRTAVRGVRKAVAANMTRSRSEIPEATVWVDVDATALVEMRAELKKPDPHNTPGLLAFIARFVIAGLKMFPELSARELDAEIRRLTAVVREGKATPADLAAAPSP